MELSLVWKVPEKAGEAPNDRCLMLESHGQIPYQG